MKTKLGMTIFAALTVTLFTMAAIHNNDLFWGDTKILSALRVDDKTWQQFFARFDTTRAISLGFVLAVSAALWLLRKRLEAAVFLLLLPTLVFTVSFPKLFVKRLRPEGSLEGMTNSFPSGTGTVSILVLGFLIYLVGEFVAPRRLRIGIQVALGVAIVLLGLFRLLAGEHWPSDVVGGYMGGALALAAIIWLHRWVRERSA
ncbi:MAG TPA: phosphatase PAP2 family protein [Dehalococcoidia bacterium]|nr:phosphatase PAP2 family protein [Dehalococcoidia bacterium]